METSTGGALYVAAQDAAGNLAYSAPLRVASRSYQALQKVLAPDPRIRLEVNLPAFELALYRGNQLLRRFRIGIGVKKWPVPPGMRVFQQIVWNPEWSPPDSPWATPSLIRRLRAQGEVLGRMKIPLGGDILIHGTSRTSDLGRLVSHGCLRMWNRDIRQLGQMLITETGVEASPAMIRRAQRNHRFSYGVELPKPVLVVIRYEPVLLRAGRVAVHRDVYGWAPVTPEQLAAVRAVADPEAKPEAPKAARRAVHRRRPKGK